MLGDITAEGVRSAVSECDQLGRDGFLKKYGFGPSRAYFLLFDGRKYDSKAICGAAHGFSRPDEGPLRSEGFSGGSASVARKLESLGFTVDAPRTSSSSWTSEERILALDAYLHYGLAGKTHPAVLNLSNELNERRFHPDAGKRANFRNPDGVALKLANFAALDPSYGGAGMSRVSHGDEATWDEYAGDTDLLDAAVAAIRAGTQLEPQPAQTSALRPRRRPLEQRLTTSYSLTPPVAAAIAERRESELVIEFGQWLKAQGVEVSAHYYDVVDPPLRNDLADDTQRRLWEAKAEVSRSCVRMAIGQLLDYRRFEESDWRIGVLLPREPSADLIALIRSVDAAAAWRNGSGGFLVMFAD